LPRYALASLASLLVVHAIACALWLVGVRTIGHFYIDSISLLGLAIASARAAPRLRELPMLLAAAAGFGMAFSSLAIDLGDRGAISIALVAIAIAARVRTRSFVVIAGSVVVLAAIAVCVPQARHACVCASALVTAAATWAAARRLALEVPHTTPDVFT
jgi:hypothetical protein